MIRAFVESVPLDPFRNALLFDEHARADRAQLVLVRGPFDLYSVDGHLNDSLGERSRQTDVLFRSQRCERSASIGWKR